MDIGMTQSTSGYPLPHTICALFAGALMSALANIEHYQRLGFENIAVNALAIGLTIVMIIKILALPIALFVSVQSGLGYKISYFKTLKIAYFIPYCIFGIGFTLFTLNWVLN